MHELIYQCSGCGARILRTRPIEQGEPCPRCGRRDRMETIGQAARREPQWLRKMLSQIEGGRGPVKWK